MRINKDLSAEERDLCVEMLYRREPALAWDFLEAGRIRPEVAPPQKIRTVPYEPWQVKSSSVPKALRKVVEGMIQERLDSGRLEPSHAAYCNPWFLVAKKNGKYRLINNATNINRVTIRDSNVPPSADEFSDAYARCQYISLTDFFSGYD
jgi:hypothetical protein